MFHFLRMNQTSQFFIGLIEKLKYFKHQHPKDTMTTYIREYWLSHMQYWIPLGDKQKEADREIYTKFNDYDFTKEDSFGCVIYLDQFMRHFSRVTNVSESLIQSCREHAAFIVSNISKEQILSVSEEELIWYLMPWKHLHQWLSVFQTIHTWLQKKPIYEYPRLNRFFMDTYKKAYTPEQIASSMIRSEKPYETYIPHDICESYPLAYIGCAEDWLDIPLPTAANPLRDTFDILKKPVTISLSGGVDSMLLCALLKREGYDVIAAHIVYGNRIESQSEKAFLQSYCEKLDIPLYLYTVEWLRRDSVSREFYEEMTRDLRFSLYKCLKRPVVLGHILDDAVENVWTNFAHGTHLDNLVKFQQEVIEDGVTIIRPWLNIRKSLIYEVADILAIPHLKNTTPTWSNRGKFRNHFYTATHTQYGESVDTKVLEVAERLKKQSQLLDRLLFYPIAESWNEDDSSVNVTQAIQAGLDGDGWLRIFTDIAHKRLKISKPSLSACHSFASRVNRNISDGQLFILKKDLKVRVMKKEGGIVCCIQRDI